MSECNGFIVDESTYEYILETKAGLYEEYSNMPGLCVERPASNWLIVYGPKPNDRELSVSDVGYYTIPKLYGLMDSSSLDASGITAVLEQPALGVSGQDVVIGFVDTGIDYTMNAFKSSRLNTRIAAIWDQTVDSVNIEQTLNGENNNSTENERIENERIENERIENEGIENGRIENGRIENRTTGNSRTENRDFQYGTIYESDQINEALRAYENGEDPYAIVPSVDEDGHGTYMASVAAASRSAEYNGAAPDAMIMMVKLKPAKTYLRDFFLIRESAKAYAETDIMNGIHFLVQYAARLRKPLVICIGVGTTSGPHIGNTPLSDMMSTTAARLNTVVVTCMGNEAAERTHYAGVAYSEQEPSKIEVNVGNGERGFVIEIWADSLDILSVALLSPSGEQIPRIPARIGSSSIFSFLLENTQISVDYRTSETVSGYEVIFLRFMTPAEGLWGINVYSMTNIRGGFNAWLPIRQFLESDNTFFLDSTSAISLTTPATALRAISVGAYDHINGGAYVESGRGYTPDNRVKPDISAPGVEVYGLLPGDRMTRRSGTSVAAAHVAGAAALLMSWGIRNNIQSIGNSEIRSILIRGANRDTNDNYPNNVMGYGKLDVINSFIQMRIV